MPQLEEAYRYLASQIGLDPTHVEHDIAYWREGSDPEYRALVFVERACRVWLSRR